MLCAVLCSVMLCCVVFCCLVSFCAERESPSSCHVLSCPTFRLLSCLNLLQIFIIIMRATIQTVALVLCVRLGVTLTPIPNPTLTLTNSHPNPKPNPGSNPNPNPNLNPNPNPNTNSNTNLTPFPFSIPNFLSLCFFIVFALSCVYPNPTIPPDPNT
jgi:hypothetical protein